MSNFDSMLKVLQCSGINLVRDAHNIIQNLLGTLNFQGDSSTPAEEISHIFNTVTLIVDLLQFNPEGDVSSISEFSVDEIFQSLRDAFDQLSDVSSVIVSSALNLLLSTCKFCTRKELPASVESCCKFYLYNVQVIKQCLNEDELKLRLRVISIILKTVALRGGRWSLLFQETCQLEYDCCIETNLLVKLVLHSSEAVSAQTLITILPHFAAVFNVISSILAVWNAALDGEWDMCNDLKRFQTLCYVFDYCAANENLVNGDVFFSLLHNDRFWKAVQHGVTNKEHVIRWQALYLLKRSVQELFDKNVALNSQELNEINGANFVEKLDDGKIRLTNGLKNFAICNNKVFLVSNEQPSTMWWTFELKEELLNLFNDVILVLETLEEKQSHIVKPVFATMMRLLGPTVCPFRNGKRLHVSWVLILFHRILNHDNASVVRWGLLNIKEIDMTLYQNPTVLRSIVSLFISHFNNSSVFVNQVDFMRNEIKKYFETVASYPDIASLFYQTLLEEVITKTWCPETLCILFDALQDINALSWESSHLLLVKKMICITISTHYTFLRAAIQCHVLKCIINLTNVSQVTLKELADVLSVFRGPECLERGSSSWSMLVKWIEFCFSKKNAEDFILSNVPYLKGNCDQCVLRNSRMICLLYDSHLFGIMKCCGEEPSHNILSVFLRIYQSFKNSDKRLYADPSMLNYNLELVRGILRENLASRQLKRSHLVEIMLPYFADLIAFVTSRSGTLTHTSDDYYQAEIFVDIVELVLKGQKMYRVISESYINGLMEFSLKSLGVLDGIESGSLAKYVSLQFLCLLLSHAYVDSTIPHLKLLRIYLKNNINICLEKHNDDTSMWGRINSKYLATQWRVIHRLQAEHILTIGNTVRVEQLLSGQDLAKHSLIALEIGGGELLLAVMAVVQDLLAEVEMESAEQLVAACWTSVWELRRSDAFASAYSRFITMLFQPQLINKSSAQSLLHAYSSLLLTDSVNGMANVYLTHVQTLGVKYSTQPLWAKSLATALLFGGTLKREDKLTQQVSYRVSSLPDCAANQLVVNGWDTNSEVRARALQIILTLTRDKHSSFAGDIIDALLSKATEVYGKKVRSFSGSLVHLIRTRHLQALLILEPLLTKEKCIYVYKWCCDLLVRESQQPSSRYLTEWLVVRILKRYSELLSEVWQNFTEALEQRVGSLCSFISVVFHATSVVPNTELDAWLNKAIVQFMPYCLAQHFSLRLYAQVALENVWSLAEKKGLCQLLNKYEIIKECQLRTVGNGNAMRNADKLRQDFYWTVFHPSRHFSLQAIFRDIPRLSHLKPDDWITPELFSKVGVTSSNPIPLVTDNDLWVHPISNWNVRSEENVLGLPTNNLQKKLIPIKSLLPDYDGMLDEFGRFSRKKEVERDGLVVVASLIDKAANLGGLCRTCEAFGVSELVVDSMQVLEGKQFQSLSLTSDKWVHITEVKVHYLADYLMKKKTDGYTVVVAEQTSRSVPLQQFVFPRKSILLLGGEKEGVPPQLLSLHDVCIEIPQFGVVRSLNVHVTGALFVWEYVKQHSHL